MTTSTSYRTRGFLIWENTSFLDVSVSGGGSGDERGMSASPSAAALLGLPRPIMCSYSSNLEVVREMTGVPLGLVFPSVGDSRLLPDKLSRRRFSRYASVSYASASDCGPIETARRRGCRNVFMIEDISEKLGSTSWSFRLDGTVVYCLFQVSERYTSGR